jgi:ABC-type nitrate/sulfonate/bicarbonate transport system substrate-binding protein
MDIDELLRACGMDPAKVTTHTTQADPEAIARHLTDGDRAVGVAYNDGWNDQLLGQPNQEDGYDDDTELLAAYRAGWMQSHAEYPASE